MNTTKSGLNFNKFDELLNNFNIEIDSYIKNELICNLKVASLSAYCISH